MSSEKSKVGYLEKWELPFSNKLCPSVSLIIPPDDFNRVKVVVMPQGLNKYPGYIIDFKRAPYFSVLDETCAPPPIPEWFDLLKAIPKSSAVIWHDSPLIKLYDGVGSYREAMTREIKLKHYIILGGDSIVDVLAYDEPVVEKFTERQKFVMEHSF